jgi:geranylgeranyl pyrophosphate synthase
MYVDRALEAIRKFPSSQDRAELENMAKYIIDRNI